MIVIPALDLRAGFCTQAAASGGLGVRFRGADPLEVAQTWERIGFRRLHVMEPGAGTARARRGDPLRDLLTAAIAAVQVGGAIDSGDQVEELLADGAALVVLGPRALAEPAWLEGTAVSFPARLIVAARVHGRVIQSEIGDTGARHGHMLDLVEELADLPLAALLLAPDYRTDGIAAEDLPMFEDAAEASPHPVLVAGGVRSIQDLRALADRRVSGVIVGTALYSGLLDPHAVADEFAE